MITMVQPLPVGNAMRLFLAPPAGALRWKLLRKAADDFTGHDDVSAVVVHDGVEKVVVDASYLTNGQAAYYRLYSTVDGAAWTASDSVFGTPSAIYQEVTTDALERVRERLEAGLLVECQRGNFSKDFIAVLNASPAMSQDLQLPLVTIHLDDESPGERGIGEMVAPDMLDAISGDWTESEGWLASVKLTAIGWSLNADERIALRKSMRRVLVANLPVFSSFGFTGFEASFQDLDALGEEYGVNMYQVLATITLTAPIVVASKVDPTTDVITNALSFEDAASIP